MQEMHGPLFFAGSRFLLSRALSGFTGRLPGMAGARSEKRGVRDCHGFERMVK